MGESFVGQRRLIAATVSAVLVFLLTRWLGQLLGLDAIIDPDELKLIVLSTTIGAVVTKWVHDQLPAGKTRGF